MNKKYFIILLVIAIFVIVCILFNKKNNAYLKKATDYEIDYIETKDEQTGKTMYQIYDKKNGKKITTTTDEAAIQAYKDNPNYQEITVDENFIVEPENFDNQ